MNVNVNVNSFILLYPSKPLHSTPLHSELILFFYTGDIIIPYIQLINTKVRVAGKFCRVGVKIRSNPSHQAPSAVKNMIVIIAVPPDASGESMKMSRKGGVWDPMKRIVIYKHGHVINSDARSGSADTGGDSAGVGVGVGEENENENENVEGSNHCGSGSGSGSGSDDLKRGETVDIQMQFEYTPPKSKSMPAQQQLQQQQGNGAMATPMAELPRFPVLVRCEGRQNQLSSVDLRVGGTLEDKSKFFRLNVDRNFKLFHRKI